MWGCGDVGMWGCVDVLMWGCVDVGMWGCVDVFTRRSFSGGWNCGCKDSTKLFVVASFSTKFFVDCTNRRAANKFFSYNLLKKNHLCGFNFFSKNLAAYGPGGPLHT